MDEKDSLGTRARILRTAMDLFIENGYQGASMHQIATRLGVTKATIFYHFPSKAHLLATLTEPLTEELEPVVDHAAGLADQEAVRHALVEGTLDVFVRNREVLRLLLHDLTLLAHDAAFRRLVHIVRRAHHVFAGPGEDLRGQVRAVQVFALLSDPVLFFDDVPVERLRAEILSGAWTLLGWGDAPATAKAGRGHRGRRAGRPSVMDGAKAAAARRMYAEGTRSVTEIAAELGVSRATVYRHLTGHGDGTAGRRGGTPF